MKNRPSRVTLCMDGWRRLGIKRNNNKSKIAVLRVIEEYLHSLTPWYNYRRRCAGSGIIYCNLIISAGQSSQKVAGKVFFFKFHLDVQQNTIYTYVLSTFLISLSNLFTLLKPAAAIELFN